MAHSVVITWNAPTAGSVPTAYNIKRSTSASGPFVQVGTVSGSVATGNSFTDTAGLIEGTTYFYEVTSVNSAGESIPSAEVSGSVPFFLPNAPTNILAKFN